jgi:hypothetical protein
VFRANADRLSYQTRSTVINRKDYGITLNAALETRRRPGQRQNHPRVRGLRNQDRRPFSNRLQRASTVGRKSLVPWPVLASEGDPTGLNPVAILVEASQP